MFSPAVVAVTVGIGLGCLLAIAIFLGIIASKLDQMIDEIRNMRAR